jgi:hypothetical protein
METTIVIHRQPNAKSLISASRHILFRTRFVKIIAVFAVLVMLNILLSPNQTPGATTRSMDWINYVSVLLIWAVLLWSIDRSIRKSIANNPKSLEPQTLTFTTQGVVSEGLSYKIEYPWSTVIRIKETRRWLLIYVTKNTALVIEKENLTDNEYNDLKKLFASLNVKKKLLA